MVAGRSRVGRCRGAAFGRLYPRLLAAPSWLLRIFLWFVTHSIYWLRVLGRSNVPGKAPPCSFAITSVMSIGCC